MYRKKVVVIGGGAAGFFGAITCARENPEVEISILEKSNKLLSKVKVSGGGRCNVTNSNSEPASLSKNYPRGGALLKKLFHSFSSKDIIKWFEERGVPLKTEADGRVFPQSNSSQTIIDTFVKEARITGVKILTGFGVGGIEQKEEKFLIKLKGGEIMEADKILVATGGNPNYPSYQWLEMLGHSIKAPVPSLFTFNVPNSRLNGLQGIAVSNATVRITGTKSMEGGPLLITHWGFSGPAILKLSAWAARELSSTNYNFNIQINWLPSYKEESLRDLLFDMRNSSPKKNISSNAMFEIPKRLWERLTNLSEIQDEMRWGDISNRQINKLIEELIRGSFQVKGKTTFKEEFVTCGGIDLKDIHSSSMESKKIPGLYFAGEILDIDGITGGYNFQAAWTTSYVAACSIAASLKDK